MAEDLSLDLEELRYLHSISKRPRVVSLISSEIRSLEKNMYDDGDDEMKRTIAKAWTDARTGKTADPLKGFP